MASSANANALGSQRKRNTNQTRPNVASQQSNNASNQQKKPTNKQTQQTAAKAQSPAPTPKPTASPAAQATKHVPLVGFNADEVDGFLSRGIDAEAETYKPEKPATQKTGPWGQKQAGTMATGKDFWLELRKQIATLQKGESTNKGG